MANKGGQWERDICRDLSEWFSGGRHDDLFWRSSQSGGRATSRRKKGKRTAGHCGDVCATERAGIPLMRVLTLELKRGYNAHHIAALLDRANGCKQQTYESWIQQAWMAHQNAGSYSWALLAKRDKKQAMIYMERKVEKALKRHGAFKAKPFVRFTLSATLQFKVGDNDSEWIPPFPRFNLVGYDLYDWFSCVPPDSIRALAKEWRNK